MHFYPFNIGDYISHTRHLSLIEDLAYRRLLDLYYLHEEPLNESSTAVARLINMRDHVDEVQTVLEEYFELDKGVGWINPRADEEIKKYQGKLDAASRAGKASAAARANGSRTVVQPNKKHETVNKKQETKINKPENVSISIWDDFLKHRKNVKAPLTATALKGITVEADKAGISLEECLTMMQTRGWRGFKAEWVKDQKGKSYNEINYGEGVQEIS